MSRIVGILIALIVAVTSQQLALARGQQAAAGSMVLCSGGGFVTIAVDARGDPVGPAHICPDGVAALIGAIGANPDPVDRNVPFRAAETVRSATMDPPEAASGLARARAPPLRA